MVYSPSTSRYRGHVSNAADGAAPQSRPAALPVGERQVKLLLLVAPPASAMWRSLRWSQWSRPWSASNGAARSSTALANWAADGAPPRNRELVGLPQLTVSAPDWRVSGGRMFGALPAVRDT